MGNSGAKNGAAPDKNEGRVNWMKRKAASTAAERNDADLFSSKPVYNLWSKTTAVIQNTVLSTTSKMPTTLNNFECLTNKFNQGNLQKTQGFSFFMIENCVLHG